MYRTLSFAGSWIYPGRTGGLRSLRGTTISQGAASRCTKALSRSLRTKTYGDTVHMRWGHPSKTPADADFRQATPLTVNNAEESKRLTELAQRIMHQIPGLYHFQDHVDSASLVFDWKLAQEPHTLSDVQTVQKRLELWFEALDNLQSTSPGVRPFALQITQNVFVFPEVVTSSGIAIGVQISNVAKANSLSSSVLNQLISVFHALSKFAFVHGVELTTASKGRKDSKQPRTDAWCGGADVTELASLSGGKEASTFIRRVSTLCTAIRTLPAPVIVSIDGACLGAGLEVAASCDIRIATDNASFSMPEVKIAIPSVAEARMLCEIVGWARARHLLLTGDTWSATEAYEAGLVTKKFATLAEQRTWVTALLQDFVSRVGVHKTQKELFGRWEEMSIEEGIEESLIVFAERYETQGAFIRQTMQGQIERRKATQPRSNGALSMGQSPTSTN